MCTRVRYTNDDTKGDGEMMFTNEQIESLNDEQAREIVELAQQRLTMMFTNYGPVALDDGGDYLFAAIYNYNRLFLAYWNNDGETNAFIKEVKDFLREDSSEWLGSDGEIRFDLVPYEED